MSGSAPLVKLAKKVVLIVEDEVLIRLALAHDLRQAGFTVIEAATGDEALIILQAVVEIGVIVTDIRMPGTMDGLALARFVTQHAPHIRVVITSANHVPDMQLHAAAVIPKPYVVSAIIRRLEELMPAPERPLLSDVGRG
jgi:CheY-like chemotaxis protein